ncbi:MAG TPA: hypothetical protein VG986_07020 [Pseudolabrys sp.]|nr:hypothetical protein [Pseudolabrys sp.]
MDSSLVDRLQALHDELGTAPASELDGFVDLALTIGRSATRSAFSEMITASRAGSTDLELLAAVPLAVAFLLKFVLDASQAGGDSETADKLCAKIRAITLALGDGSHSHSALSPASSH